MNTRIKISIVLLVLLISNIQCTKKQFLKYGNELIFSNPFINFFNDHPEYITGFSPDCELLLIDENGDEHNLDEFDRTKDKITIDLDYSQYEDVLNFKKPLKVRATISYFNENSYVEEYNPNSGEYDRYFVSNAYDYYVSTGIDMDLDIKPNRIYSIDMLAGTITDEGEYQTDEQDNSSNSCYVGTWKWDDPSCDASGSDIIYNFNNDGSGTLQRPIVQGYGGSCEVLCIVTFYFNWTDKGNGTIHFDYYDISNDCGQDNPSLPDSEDIQITCNGSTLQIGTGEYTKY